MLEYKNVFYFSSINVIGGVESFFYYIAKRFKDWDITVIYKKADKNQIKRLKQYVRTKEYHGEKIKCEKVFFNYTFDIIDNIDAREYWMVIHADYKAQKKVPRLDDRITHFIGVSQVACDSFEELTGIKPTLVYNFIELDKPKKVLKFIAATRLTEEKGKERLISFLKKFDNAHIPYILFLFTDDSGKINNPNIIYMEPKLNISDYIVLSDYLVQLSDCEAFGFSPVEALSLGVPVIVTKCPVFYELGFNEENSIMLDFDLSNLKPEEVYTKHFDFKYTPPKSDWDKILAPGKSTYEYDKDSIYIVEALDTYKKGRIVDVMLGYIPDVGERFEVDNDRLEVLLGDNKNNDVFVKVIGKKETKKGVIK